jgi:hypothetical protein
MTHMQPAETPWDPEPSGRVPGEPEIQQHAMANAPAKPPMLWRCPNLCGFVESWPAGTEPPASVNASIAAHQIACPPPAFG